MLQLKSYTSDLDDLHKSQWTGDLALANKVQIGDVQGREPHSTSTREIANKAHIGEILEGEYKNLNLKFESLQDTTYIQ